VVGGGSALLKTRKYAFLFLFTTFGRTPIFKMGWTIELPRTEYNRTHYIAEIRALNEELVKKDEGLKSLLAASNVKFESFVASIRKVVENVYPDKATRPKAVLKLLKNTNWANHGSKDTTFREETVVDVDHCDEMCDLFREFVNAFDGGEGGGGGGGGEGGGGGGSDDIDALSQSLRRAKVST
jgi:hypothetical protein